MNKQHFRFISGLISLFILIGCQLQPLTEESEETTVFATPRETPAIEDVEKYGRFQLPESAENVEYYVEIRGIDDLVAVKFEMPPEDLSEFLSNAGYEEPLERIEWLSDVAGYALGLDNIIPGWPSDSEWEAAIKDEAKDFFGATVSEPGFSRNVLVDKTSPESYVIYLVHHGL